MTSENSRRGEARLPTMTATPARVALFQPSQRPQERDGTKWHVTSWGRCSVKGRLGQRHADVLEALLYVAETRTPDHRLLVDPYRWRKVAGGGRLMSHEHLGGLIDNMAEAFVRIETTRGWKVRGTMINAIREATKRNGERVVRFDPWTRAATRSLMTITLGDVLVELLRLDHALWHNPAPLARLETGMGQAIARHCLTHPRLPQGGGWFIDELIKAVTGDDQLQGGALREARRAVRRDAAGLAELGYRIEQQKLFLREGVGQAPEGVGQAPEGVGQAPEGVGQAPDEMRV